MYLYLMRHATAFNKEEDPNRSLNEQGREEATRVADFLKEKHIVFSNIFHSPITRSIETAHIVAKTLNITAVQLLAPLDADFPVQTLIQAIDHLESGSLLVGHLPNIEHVFNAYLSGSYYNAIVDFPPATLGCFKKESNSWILQWLINPKLLGA